ncbi:type II toxin-antitoxin system RelE/ParE family toxin [Patescibacteria group bacterium]|nr:type II toxin-antitoxin system RelE/ParE family toxin [Patescibacteria group bacterium]MBU4454927.1 type II toxin-antitoxin system RelE/ParE family toxin [Patescibacteria group bacterium]MDP3043760.1 type II toxin-antitoxin system RelE/ParE family toxin [bacterium]
MAFVLEIKPKARKDLDKIPENYRARIIAALDEIVRDPFSGKKLSGKKKGLFSFRVWPYRIIYAILGKELVVLVISIGHRQGVY